MYNYILIFHHSKPAVDRAGPAQTKYSFPFGERELQRAALGGHACINVDGLAKNRSTGILPAKVS